MSCLLNVRVTKCLSAKLQSVKMLGYHKMLGVKFSENRARVSLTNLTPPIGGTRGCGLFMSCKVETQNMPVLPKGGIKWSHLTPLYPIGGYACTVADL